MDESLCTDELLTVSAQIRDREVSPVDVVEVMLDRISRLNGQLNAYVTVCANEALEQAKQAEAEIASGKYRGPLHGITFAVKDIVETKGILTTCGSALFENWVPDRDATVVTRFKEAGAILVGKLRTTEFALYGYPVGWPVPVNPWNKDYWAGVSSAGTGAAVAASLCHVGIGTDTGGSIRFPSAANGVVGVKATYGKISRAGVFPLAETLDHVGPMTHSVSDAAAVLNVIAGVDAADPTSRNDPDVDFLQTLKGGMQGLRIGYDPKLCSEGIDEALTEAVNIAIELLRDNGANLIEVDASRLLEGVAEIWLMLAAEAVVSHRDLFPARAEEYGPIFRDLLERGNALPGSYYAQGAYARHRNIAATARLFEEIDVLVLPATPNANIKVADFPPSEVADFDNFPPLLKVTAPFDLNGAPTINLPCGFLPDDAPMAIQFAGRPGDEVSVLRAAFSYEKAAGWHNRRPKI